MEEHKQYHKRLHLAYSDLLDSKSYAELLLKKSKENFGSDERTIFKAILTSFVVSYGRALTRSNTEEKKYDAIVSAKFKKFIKVTSMHLLPEEKKQYEFLLNERDKIFSHSDARSHDLRQCKILDTVGYFGNNILYGYPDDKIDISIKTINYFLSKISNKQKQIERLCTEAFD